MKTGHTMTLGRLLTIIAVVGTLATMAFPHMVQANGVQSDPSNGAQSSIIDDGARNDNSQ